MCASSFSNSWENQLGESRENAVDVVKITVEDFAGIIENKTDMQRQQIGMSFGSSQPER